MSTESFILTSTEWQFLRTLELGHLDLSGAEAALQRLETLGLVIRTGAGWEATDYGRLLAASRRSL